MNRSRIKRSLIFGSLLVLLPVITVAATALPPPVTVSGSTASTLLSVTNSGTGNAITTSTSSGYAVYAASSAAGIVLRVLDASTTKGNAIYATSAGHTITGISTIQSGIVGYTKLNNTASNNAAGVKGTDASTSGRLMTVCVAIPSTDLACAGSQQIGSSNHCTHTWRRWNVG